MSTIEVIKMGEYDPISKLYQLWALSDTPLPVKTKLEVKGSYKISTQLRGFYFLLIEEIFSNTKLRFSMVSESDYRFFYKIISLFKEFEKKVFIDYETFSKNLITMFRYSLNVSLGKPASIQDMNREDLIETIQLIIEKASFVGIDLEEFLDEKKPLSLKKEERKKRKRALREMKQ